MITSTVKKVLMTADTVGGVWNYALDLIRAFESERIQVLLATMGRTLSAEQWEQVQALENVEVAESNYRLEWMDDPWADVSAAGEWLLALEREFAPDVVHLNGYSHGNLPWIAPKVVVAHSCVLSWWQAVKGGTAPDAWQRYRDAVAAGLQAAELVIAPSGAMLGSLQEHYGALRRTRVISNGRQLDLFQPAEKQNFILSAGRLWDEAKNVRAVCACSLDLPWPVCLAGETELPRSGLTQFLAPRGNVRMLGHLDGHAMAEHLGKASIFAHPARYEPFGLAVLEAALSGCALVLGDIPSLRENWNGAAIFVDPEDHAELSGVLRGLIDKPLLREELGRAALKRGRQFNIHLTAMRYIEAYESVLLSKSAAGTREECIAV